ncbi:MBL fold metallo-hydrolase [Ructibacterium gallinarum]|uniref:MBL fold metallo-hydrolase n=1 Tax=Ructibacterium gallinarum TaxID=2779355 RepID=A0A9D5M4J0_9FIRM|nr:MBL fold metallo-hydrolase [Ructibacterium gallinarum]MBE5040574.1 MBL fold metallo-hydrolase [Ructibacterium gallinarum]
MLRIKWLGQSGYLLTDGKYTICIDPYLSNSVETVTGAKRLITIPIMPEELQVDMIICTHNHLDHLDPCTIKAVDKSNTIFFAPLDCEMLLKELGVLRYTPFDVGTNVRFGEIELRAVHAKHTVPAVGVLVCANGHRLYFTGDTFYDSKLEQIKCDILFVCINGKLGNMSVSEAIKLTQKLQPKVAVPNHYGMFVENTEEPTKYLSGVDCGFAMRPNVWYEIYDILDKKV